MKFQNPAMLSLRDRPQSQELRPCFCTGPRNGDPVCPCQMQHLSHHEAADFELWLKRRLAHLPKPRVRVKAISRRVEVAG
ncbi:hypothetical protein [Mesorhizobium sp. M4A.F.Ca.ET.090.04.2.1]|uniref:hypothetical protein n=1 Tax=Mesorhizobium sp. M4A.F.Ca.ET.090.04.2.1 TaxID=2496663 RepID=UPI000FCB0C0D|nr:hypothetical protein [Mesorhizobium sp. M4A.F.Ca.ET.090.04.2.1]